MHRVISVVGLKGGVGKSTVALNLGCCLARNRRVLLVDCDSQATLRAWAAHAADEERAGPPVVGVAGSALRRDLPQVARGYDVVLVDCPARLGAETRAAMALADLVLMPVLPGAPDVWALRETLAALEEVRAVRPELLAGVVFNRTAPTLLARTAHAQLETMGQPVLRAALGNRVAYGEATLAGCSVMDSDGPAQLEVRRLTAEVTRMMEGERHDKKQRGHEAH